VTRGLKPGVEKSGSTLTCRVCGSTFYRSLNEVLKHKTFYCSVACFSIGRQTKVSRTCKTCGKEFRVQPSYLVTGAVEFCSQACYTPEERSARNGNRKAATPKPVRAITDRPRDPRGRKEGEGVKSYTYNCAQCGNPILITGHQRNHRKRRAEHFCNRSCWYDFIRAHPEANGRWLGGAVPYFGPNWNEQAKQARERDADTCQRCGKHQTVPLLDVHHIRPRRAFNGDWERANDLANLISYCKRCHKLVESQITAVA
jgi:5-methylcytosine-specific restriction endonuclease McrA